MSFSLRHDTVHVHTAAPLPLRNTIHIYKWSCTQTKTQNVTLYYEQSFKSKEKNHEEKGRVKQQGNVLTRQATAESLKTSNNAQRTKGRHCCGVHVRRPPEYHYVRRKLQTQVQKKGPWSWFPEAMWIYPEAWKWNYRFFSRSQNGKGTVCRKRGRPVTLCLSSRFCVTW